MLLFGLRSSTDQRIGKADWMRSGAARALRVVAVCVSVCSRSDYTPAATSLCSDPTTIATIRAKKGLNSPILKAYEGLGARVKAKIDAVRTIRESQKGVLCEARLTINVIRILQNRLGDSSTATDTPQDRPGILSSDASEIFYKVEITDDEQNYVTVIPSDPGVR